MLILLGVSRVTIQRTKSVNCLSLNSCSWIILACINREMLFIRIWMSIRAQTIKYISLTCNLEPKMNIGLTLLTQLQGITWRNTVIILSCPFFFVCITMAFISLPFSLCVPFLWLCFFLTGEAVTMLIVIVVGGFGVQVIRRFLNK